MIRAPEMIHENATARTLGFLRIWVFAMWFGDVAKDPITDLAGLPMAYFNPLGVVRLLPLSVWERIFTPEVLTLWQAAMLVGLALTIVGARPYRPIALITCILLTFQLGAILSFGYLVHTELVSLYVCYLLALFPAADALSLSSRRARPARPALYRAAMQLAALVLCTTYTFVGVRRLVLGGVGIFLDGSVLWYVAKRSAQIGYFSHTHGLSAVESPWLSVLMQIGYAVVTLFEVLSLLCLVSRKFRRAWLAVIVPFQLAIWPLMQILFLHNIMLIMVLLTDVEGVVAWVERRAARVASAAATGRQIR